MVLIPGASSKVRFSNLKLTHAVRPSLFDPALSSPGPLGQEIPFNCQLANLSVKLGRLPLPLLLAVARTNRAAREQARNVVEDLFFQA